MAPEARGEPFSTQIATLIGAAVIALVASFSCDRGADAADFAPWTEGPQPNFTLPAVDGSTVALGAQRGDVVLVHFFATWCEACRDELPALMRLAHRGGTPVKILAVSLDDSDARVQRFLQSTPVSFPVLLDRDRAVAKSWKVSMLPTTFVLDSGLKPRLVVETDYAWDNIDPKDLIDAMSAAHGPNQTQKNPLAQNREGSNNALR